MGKNYYDDYFNALERSIIELYPQDQIPTLSLSSGTDSGVIAACLHAHNKPFNIVSFAGQEDQTVLQQRLELLDRRYTLIPTLNERDVSSVLDEMSCIGYENVPGSGIYTGTGHYMLCKHTDSYIYSGLGSDEIYTDNITLFLDFIYVAHISYNYYNKRMLYPLIQTRVMREFWNLDPKMRADYKQPLREYLKSKSFPWAEKRHFYIWEPQDGEM